MPSAPGSFFQSVLVRSWTQRTLLSWTLWPISLLLGFGVRLRILLYRSGLLKAQRVGVPVIVVGNVVAGGAGKTPVVIALAEHLMRQGFRPGIVSRGYGRQTHVCMEVNKGSTALEAGDEPALIKRRLDVPVFVAAKRADAACALLARYPGTNIIVCDDGLQHLALHRDIEICVFDDRGTGNGLLLPAGPLREPWPRSVDLVVHTGQHPAFPGFRAYRSLQVQAHRSNGSTVGLDCLATKDAPPLLAVAAVAQPALFFEMLKAKGLHLSLTVALPDHDDFSRWERPCDQEYVLLCTEKDAVKIWDKHPDALAVRLNCELEVAFLKALDQRLAQTVH